MNPYWKLRTRSWRRRILILLSLTILGLIATAGSAGVNRPEKLLHTYGCRLSGVVSNNSVAGITSQTADGRGNFTSGTLFFSAGNAPPVIVCQYNLTSGTYIVNLDNTGESTIIWDLTNNANNSANCPNSLTLIHVIVLEGAEKHNVAEQFDFVERGNPVGGVCTQQ